MSNVACSRTAIHTSSHSLHIWDLGDSGRGDIKGWSTGLIQSSDTGRGEKRGRKPDVWVVSREHDEAFDRKGVAQKQGLFWAFKRDSFRRENKYPNSCLINLNVIMQCLTESPWKAFHTKTLPSGGRRMDKMTFDSPFQFYTVVTNP